jgi:hypothetical protein
MHNRFLCVYAPAFVPESRRRGYDVFAFASAGASVAVGLDICPIAVQAAQAEQQLVIGDNPDACAASKLIAGDFFSHDSSPDFKGPYDIGYDYTFLCALHPGEWVLLMLPLLLWGPNRHRLLLHKASA